MKTVLLTLSTLLVLSSIAVHVHQLLVLRDERRPFEAESFGLAFLESGNRVMRACIARYESAFGSKITPESLGARLFWGSVALIVLASAW